MPIKLFTLIVLVSFASHLKATNLKGHILDSKSHEPLTGAAIFDKKNGQINDLAGLDGSFVIKNLKPGTYVFEIHYLGYKPQEKEVHIAQDRDMVSMNILLEPDITVINQVEIVGSYNKESNFYARSLEKKSDNVLNVIAARTIQLLPDNTTASVLQRMSGVSVERTSSGEARYAIIRGMDRRYNYTLVNGIKIPSPDDKFRYVPMDMFPAELLGRLEVIKALTPSMEGDAIGGAMNLVMKDAPDTFTLHTNIGSGFSELFTERHYSNFDPGVVNDKSPADIHGETYQATPYDFTFKNFDYHSSKLPFDENFGLSVGDRFLKGKKLGVIFAGSYQNVYNGSNEVWLRPENQPQPGNVPSFDDIYIRQYNKNSIRIGIHSKIDYEINPDNKISLYNLLVQMNDVQYRGSIDTSLSIGRDGVGTGNTYHLYRSMIHNQSIYNSTLQGQHTLFGSFKVKWSAVYSLAKNAKPDWSEYITAQQVGFDIHHNHTATPQHLDIPFYRIWTRNTDKDYAGYLNMSYNRNILGQDVTIETGGMYRDKSRDNHFNEWKMIPRNINSSGDYIPFDGNLTPDKFWGFNGASAAEGEPKNPSTYSASEKIWAAYIQATIQVHKRLSILGGVRVENTNQGWVTALDPKTAPAAIGNVTYQDLLPSLHVKYHINSKQNIRASFFSAINRPGFDEYIPQTVPGDNFDRKGNPYLLHATADNFDLRYEYFPTPIDQILIGAFYKNIKNPIETGIDFTGTSAAALKPVNATSGAVNYGFEVSLTKFWGHVGISGNYTYTYSRVTRLKAIYDTAHVNEYNVPETGPLGGQSPSIGNFSLLFKNPRAGINAQLALVYTGRNITLISPYKGLDYWQKSTSQLSFSFEKRILKYFTFYLKANNLLNTPVLVQILKPNVYKTGKFALPYQSHSDRVTVKKDVYGQSFSFGIRFKNL